jgi:hypothetical protein
LGLVEQLLQIVIAHSRTIQNAEAISKAWRITVDAGEKEYGVIMHDLALSGKLTACVVQVRTTCVSGWLRP